jgi:hypothetical protein
MRSTAKTDLIAVPSWYVCGRARRCTDDIRHTLEHMYALGVTDPHLAKVLETAEDIRARAAARRAR